MTLRPKSNKLTRIGQIPTITNVCRSLYSELPMAAFGSGERSAHEQPPAASIWRVAIVHNYIISR